MTKRREAKVYDADLEADVSEDSRNANLGSERGHGMLERSIAELGAGRSIVVDKNGRTIGGNKTRDALIAAGLTDAIVVETDGTRPVIVKRTDLDLGERKGRARRLAYADNRVAEVDLSWDPDVLRADKEEGLLDGFFSDAEVDRILDKEKDPDIGGEPDLGDDARPKSKPGDLWILGDHRLEVGKEATETADDLVDRWEAETGGKAQLEKKRKAKR